MSRAQAPSRVAASKLSDPTRIGRSVEELDLYALIDPVDLSIDNSDLPPEHVADQFRERFRIDRAGV